MSYKLRLAILLMAVALVYSPFLTQSQSAPPGHKVGTIKSINGNTLVLTSDAGQEFKITIADSAKILRVPPGQLDLKNGVPLELKDLQVGDRVLTRGSATGDEPFLTSMVVVMKQADIAQKHQSEREDWQKRGISGLVTAADPHTGVFTISLGQNNLVTVKTSEKTKFLRYSPVSVKFSDAQKGTAADIKVGDQLRALGTRSADGKELQGEEVISGSFRNIAGMVMSVDTANNAVRVMDLLTKKSVTVKVNSTSQLRKLPAFVANGLASLVKRPAANTQSVSAKDANDTSGQKHGAPDIQHLLAHLPPIALSELQKGDALMIVSTPESDADVTAIALLSGVEPILTASPSGAGAATLLAGWNVSGPPAEGGAQ